MRVFWGAGSSLDTGAANFNLVQWEVPEPMTLAVFGVGFAALIVARRRRRT